MTQEPGHILVFYWGWPRTQFVRMGGVGDGNGSEMGKAREKERGSWREEEDWREREREGRSEEENSKEIESGGEEENWGRRERVGEGRWGQTLPEMETRLFRVAGVWLRVPSHALGRSLRSCLRAKVTARGSLAWREEDSFWRAQREAG